MATVKHQWYIITIVIITKLFIARHTASGKARHYSVNKHGITT